MTFMIYVVCHDLAEQLELIHELDAHGSLEYEATKLAATSVFFANLEHFWGMMEVCQEGLLHRHRDEEKKHVWVWIKQKLGMR